MKNLEIYDKFRAVPNEAKKEIGAGRLKGFTDIIPMWRIKMLTDQFGACGFGWYTEIVKEEIVEKKHRDVDRDKPDHNAPIFWTGGAVSGFLVSDVVAVVNAHIGPSRLRVSACQRFLLSRSALNARMRSLIRSSTRHPM